MPLEPLGWLRTGRIREISKSCAVWGSDEGGQFGGPPELLSLGVGWRGSV